MAKVCNSAEPRPEALPAASICLANCDLTNSVLDSMLQIREDDAVKILSNACILAIGAILCLGTGCKPNKVDPQRLEELQTLNEHLRTEIEEMESMLRRAGEDTPNLEEDIRERQMQVADMQRQITKQQDEIHEANVTVLRLRDRLSAFRDTFSEMQNTIATQSPQP